MKRTPGRSVLARTFLFGLLLPCLYFGAASATFLFRVRSKNASPARLAMQAAPATNSAQRIVIFAPHPDDETLGCAGLIQQAREAGAEVTVAVITNGDGFRVAVERQFRELRLEPTHYVQFAAMRQQETYRVLAGLGIDKSNVLFLGYPDRGLLPLWTDHWSPERCYRSPYTQSDRSPYANTFEPRTPYCGERLLRDVDQILRETKPTDVYVTHPSDDHPDHTAASSFVTLAMQRLKAEDMDWARSANLQYYIVHRGDWPVPQGLHKSDPLSPPAELTAADTKWATFALSEAQVSKKSRAIMAYASQTAIMKRFLTSFARTSELFGSMEPGIVPAVDEARDRSDLLGDWTGYRPVAKDPVNDNLIRDLQAGGDVRTLFAARGASRLYLRVDTYQPVSPRVEFRISLRYFGDPARSEPGGTLTLTVRPGKRITPANIPFAHDGNALDLSIPLRDIGYARRIAVNIETRFTGIQVDRTGYRFLEM